MKNALIIGLVYCLLGNCTNKPDPYVVEQNMLDCFYKAHATHSINIKQTMQQIESIFLRYHVLKDTSGQSYYGLLQQLSKSANFILEADPGFNKALDSLKYIPNGIRCRDSAFVPQDSLEIIRSKFYQVTQNFSNTLDTLQDVHFGLLLTSSLDILTPEDFDHTFYKTLTLSLLASMVRHHTLTTTNTVETLPILPPHNGPQELDENNIFSIMINKKGAILAQNNPVKIHQLKAMVTKFLLSTKSKYRAKTGLKKGYKFIEGIISINTQQGAPYKSYVQVLDKVQAAYNQLRDQYARKIFNKGYEKLNELQQDTIRQLVPLNISETSL